MATRYLSIGLDEKDLERLDQYARHMRGLADGDLVISRSNAIRSLVRSGLRHALKGHDR